MNDFSSARKNLSSIMLSLQGQRRRCQDLSIRKKGSRIDYSTAPPSRVITHGTTNKLSQLKHVAPSSSGCCLKSRKTSTRTYYFATHKAHFQCTPSQHMQNSKNRMQRAGRIPAFLLQVTKEVRGHTIPGDQMPELENGCTITPRCWKREPSRVSIMANTFLS